MINWFPDTNLKPYNTFGIKVRSAGLALARNPEDVIAILEHINRTQRKLLILGGGSNVLLTQDWPGVVLLNRLEGYNIVDESHEQVIVKVNSGEDWHKLVMWSVNHGLYGIENLALIYGSVGAGPMQNIGAYGVELKDVFVELEAIHLKNGNLKQFKLTDCEFSYRSSVFKNSEKDNWFIMSVTLKLSKIPRLVLDYGQIREELNKRKIETPTSKDIAKIVMDIRRSKLPEPAVLGNAGSFFKNPEVSENKAFDLKSHFPEMPMYDSEKIGFKKLAAGWLIESCGLKGFKRGSCGVHDKQALVLVNFGGASGKEILSLAHFVQEQVYKKFDIALEPEVNIL